MQGDQEKAIGPPRIPLMDRDTKRGMTRSQANAFPLLLATCASCALAMLCTTWLCCTCNQSVPYRWPSVVTAVVLLSNRQQFILSAMHLLFHIRHCKPPSSLKQDGKCPLPDVRQQQRLCSEGFLFVAAGLLLHSGRPNVQSHG